MLEKRLFILSGLFVILSLFFYSVIVGLKNIKIDDFKPAAVIFLIDSSKSNQINIDEQKKFIKQICKTMDPEDKVKILQFSNDSYLIYEGSPQNSNEITKSLNSYTSAEKTKNLKPSDVLKKAVSYSLVMKQEGYIPAIVVISDLENDANTSKYINWNTLPENIQNTKMYIPDLTMSFVWAHPAKLDFVKEKLAPILGEEHLIISTDQTIDKIPAKIFKSIGR